MIPEHFYRGQPILVTGGAGYIGSNLVDKLLSLEANVTVVDNLSTGRLENLSAVLDTITFIDFDLRRDDLKPLLAEGQFKTVFHLAGQVGVPPSVEDPQNDFETNAQVTLNVLNAIRAATPQTPLIYASSAAAYGQGSAHALKETDPTVPIAPYGISKLTGEHYTRVFAAIYGLKTASLRLFATYGPRLRGQVTYDLIQKLLRDPENLFLFGDGSQVRDVTNVSDIADAFLLVAAKGRLEGEIYNTASEEVVTIRRLAVLICEAMDVTPRFTFSGDVRPGDAQNWTADITRLKALGYTPKVTLKQGLVEMVKWCRQEAAQPSP